MYTNLDRIKMDIENLSEFNSTKGNGLTRFSLTKEDRKAREYIKNELSKLNLEIYEDNAGTIFGKLQGTNSELPSIMIGSHFDSVKNGGNFDGPAGIVMGLEILRTLKENNIKLKHSVEFVGMIEEEGGRFGSGVFGSRAMAKGIEYSELLQNKDADGVSMAEAFEAFGFDPTKIKNAKRDPKEIKAFIELHIEQGPVLENEKIDLGIVDFIVGITEFKIKIKGKQDHAGTTPMNMRSDALVASSRLISEIEKFAIKAGEGTVATVGMMKVLPGAGNIVPGEVEFVVDIRSKSQDCIDEVKGNIINYLETLEKSSNFKWEKTEMLNVLPVSMSKSIIEILEKNSLENGFKNKIMTSGAGHDAMIMGSITDVGLVFVPSKDGRSHCHEEWTDYDQLQRGIEVIYKTVIDIGGKE